MRAWAEQVKFRGLSEQPNDIRVTTKSCNIKLEIGITSKKNQHKTVNYKLEIVFYTKTDVSPFPSPNIFNIGFQVTEQTYNAKISIFHFKAP